MIKKLILIIILILPMTPSFSQVVLPVSKENILIFIEPFEDLGPDNGQAWLTQGLPRFIKSNLEDTRHLKPYIIPDFETSLVDRPHRLQDMIWKSVFQKEVDPAYETYLILGSYSYIENRISVRMDLLSLSNTRVLAHFENTLDYTKLLTWKQEMGVWILSQLHLVKNPQVNKRTTSLSLPDAVTPMPGVPISDQLTILFNSRQQNEMEDLEQKYVQQSRLKLGSQLKSLWHDIAYDPYLANIYDVQTRRLQFEPDSVQVNFKISYRIIPRILDEIEYFSKTRAGLVVKTESFEDYAFMDLGYIDAEFSSAVARGDWRVVPVITMGPEGSPNRRVFYHSFPRPINPPGKYYYNQGQFKQLLVAIPGVDALRIFAQAVQQVYEYSVVVGYDEIQQLEKIQVKFVAEQDLANQL